MAKFGVEERLELLKVAGYSFVKNGEAVFHQGDIGDRMYIILKGAVNVVIHDKAFGEVPLVVATLKDNAYFGELALTGEGSPSNREGRRRASIICIEDSEFLTIPSQYFIHLEVKLRPDIAVLQSTLFFKNWEPKTLLPLMCKVERLRYKFGEYILREGEVPRGMYVIRKGECAVCIESLGMRKINKLPKSKNDPEKLYEFTSTDLQVRKDKKGWKPLGFNNKIVHMDDKGNHLDTHLVYQNNIIVTRLSKPETFGQRVLLPIEFIFGSEGTTIVKHESLPSMLSIIADSSEVEIFLLSRELIDYFNNDNKFDMHRIIVEQTLDVTRPMSESEMIDLKNNFGKWEEYKMSLTEKVLSNPLPI